jgi:pyridoxine 5'-phosphate synthase PdxJ
MVFFRLCFVEFVDQFADRLFQKIRLRAHLAIFDGPAVTAGHGFQQWHLFADFRGQSVDQSLTVDHGLVFVMRSGFHHSGFFL